MSAKSLGKGLSALIPQEESRNMLEINIDEIVPNKYQPRKKIENEGLDNLAESIRQKGMLQPILVRRKGANYEIIAGERRWRAAKKLGHLKISAIVMDVNDSEQSEMSIIENIQREQLNSIEEADAYKSLIEKFGLTQEEVAKRIGKDRVTVTNKMRLLKLPDEVKNAIISGEITEGHARVIAGLEAEKEQLDFFRKILSGKLTVRKTEEEAKTKKRAKKTDERKEDYYEIRELIETLISLLGTKVEIKREKKGGRIVIKFSSDRELERILEIMKR